MRDDGRIVALGGGFQALWPLTAGVVTFPWVVRDLDSQHLHAGSGAAAPEVSAELHPVRRSSGLLARRAACLSRQRDPRGPASSAVLRRSCTTIEYTSPAPASCRRFTPSPLASPSSTAEPCRSSSRCSSATLPLRNFSRYDRRDRPSDRGSSQDSGSNPATGGPPHAVSERPAVPSLLDERYGVPLPMPAPVREGIARRHRQHRVLHVGRGGHPAGRRRHQRRRGRLCGGSALAPRPRRRHPRRSLGNRDGARLRQRRWRGRSGRQSRR